MCKKRPAVLHIADKAHCFSALFCHLLQESVDPFLIFHEQKIRGDIIAVKFGRTIDHQKGKTKRREHTAVFVMKQFDAENAGKFGYVQVPGKAQEIKISRKNRVDGQGVTIGGKNLLHAVQGRHPEMGITRSGCSDQGDFPPVRRSGLHGGDTAGNCLRESGRIHT